MKTQPTLLICILVLAACSSAIPALAGNESAQPPRPATLPAPAPVGRLEFRIAPSPSSLDQAELARLKKDLDSGMVGTWWRGTRIGGRIPEYAWLPRASGTANDGLLITGKYDGQTYVLVSDKPGEAMVPGEGKEAWGLTKVSEMDEGSGVLFELDDRGTELFSALTKAHVGEVLAMVVDGKVVSAPVLRSALGRSGVITGKWTAQELKDLSAILKTGMVRSPKPATASRWWR